MRLSRHWHSLAAGGLLLSTAMAASASDLLHMLERMARADQQQSYQGTFVLRKADSLSALRVIHGVDDKGVWESIESLNGEPQTILRHNNRVVTIYPQRKLLTVRHTDSAQALHQQLPDNFSRLERYYRIQQDADDRIAGHDTLVVDVLPRDEYRYAYRYWIEKNTGVLLRCDLFDDQGNVIEQMMFTSLQMPAQIPKQAFDLSHYQDYQQRIQQEPDISVDFAALQWRVKDLPEGFVLTQSHLRYLDPQQQTPARSAQPDLLHLVYSDGLASVSLFIEKNRGEDAHLQGESRVGAVNAYGMPMDKFFITAVGDVPMKTVKAIAGNIEYLP